MVSEFRFTLPMCFLAMMGCADNQMPSARADLSGIKFATDADPEVQRLREALVRLCVQEPSLSLAIEPTATRPALRDPDTGELQIDLWMIDVDEMTFKLLTTSEQPIWIVYGSFVEQNGTLIADATIAELHYD